MHKKNIRGSLGLIDKCLKLVCTIRLNVKSHKLKIGMYIMRQNSRNLHDCKFMFQETWELYDVTLQVIVFFKFYVMNLQTLWLISIHISPHMYLRLLLVAHITQVLLFAKHCTYNCECLWSDQPRLKNILSFMQNCFVALKRGRLFKI